MPEKFQSERKIIRAFLKIILVILLRMWYTLPVWLKLCRIQITGGDEMEISYKKLWKILIDKDMKKKDLQAAAGISWASVTKLSKGETVSMEVLMKVCKTLGCDIGDVMELIPDEGEVSE